MFAVQMDSLLNTRALLNASLAEDQQLSANDLLVKAAALAMKTVPDVNASWMETSVRMYSRCDINVVLGVGDGLVAPVVVDAGGKGVKAISDEVRTQQLTYTAQKFVNMSVA
jgi:pyruvate dehydrogenase E2 component (dihydrolipoamide acetyltransferase)